jgi:hypothetical protein
MRPHTAQFALNAEFTTRLIEVKRGIRPGKRSGAYKNPQMRMGEQERENKLPRRKQRGS